MVAVINSKDESRALYKLIAAHQQNNHALLQEGAPHFDSVDIHTYKYFKFTLMDQPSDLINVTFEIAPLHGDCDLFISKDSNLFPNKDLYQKKSQRIGALVDHITFSKADNISSDLNGTYYVGVYGYSYATFSLLVTVHRNKSDAKANLNRVSTILYEGFPFTKRLHNELDMFIGRF